MRKRQEGADSPIDPSGPGLRGPVSIESRRKQQEHVAAALTPERESFFYLLLCIMDAWGASRPGVGWHVRPAVAPSRQSRVDTPGEPEKPAEGLTYLNHAVLHQVSRSLCLQGHRPVHAVLAQTPLQNSHKPATCSQGVAEAKTAGEQISCFKKQIQRIWQSVMQRQKSLFVVYPTGACSGPVLEDTAIVIEKRSRLATRVPDLCQSRLTRPNRGSAGVDGSGAIACIQNIRDQRENCRTVGILGQCLRRERGESRASL
jgi:hypothetical protein